MKRSTSLYCVAGIVMSMTFSATAQRVFGTFWKSTIGEIGNGVVHSVIKTGDNNYLMTGTLLTDSNGTDVFIAKIDTLGKRIWSRQYGGRRDDSGVKTVLTFDGGFISIGSTYSNDNGSSDFFIQKFSQNGTREWVKYAGGLDDDFGTSIKQLPDSGYIACGNTIVDGTNQDFVVIRYSSTGSVLWSKNFGSSSFEQINDLVIVNDGIVLVGSGVEYGKENQILVLKIDFSGRKVWNKGYGGEFDDVASSVIATVDGKIALVGTTYSYGNGDADIILLKLDSNGNSLWYKTFGGECVDMGVSLKQFGNGDYLISATSRSFAPKYSDATIILTDPSGNTKYVAPVAGTFTESGSPITILSDSTFVVSHHSTGDVNTYALLTKLGLISPSRPTSKTIKYQAFTCVNSLDSIGFFNDENEQTHWDIDQGEEAMISTSKRPSEKASIYSSGFNGSISDDTVFVTDFKIQIPTDGGPKWEEKIRFWFSLTNGTNKLYTIWLKPVYDKKKSKRWDLKLIRDFDDGNEECEEKQKVIASVSTSLKTVNVLVKSKIGLRMAKWPDGTIKVYMKMGEREPWLTVLTTIDNTYTNFTNLHFRYKTGAKEFNYQIYVDDINVRLVPLADVVE